MAIGQARTNAGSMRPERYRADVSPGAREREMERWNEPRSQAGLGGTGGNALSQGLGWFSVALGLAELAAPSTMARLIGMEDEPDNHATLRACGLRELATGIGILTRPAPEKLLRARVAGDVMDLVLLGSAMTTERSNPLRLAMATAAVAGVTALDVLGASGGGSDGFGNNLFEDVRRRGAGLGARAAEALGVARDIHVRASITVNRPVDEVYRFWHDFENLPRFMSHLEEVRVTGEGRSHWKTKAPAGTTVEWDAELIGDETNAFLAWRSLAGADVDNAGSVRFEPAPGQRGTEVHVELSYRPPGGPIGAAIAKLLGEAPDQQVRDDLRAFKQVLETGEIVRSDASIHRLAHPAQPSGMSFRRSAPSASPFSRGTPT